jgi:hypothetical protein
MLPYESQIFITAAGLEFLTSLYKKRKLYSLDDSINSISCGVVSLRDLHIVFYLLMINKVYEREEVRNDT